MDFNTLRPFNLLDAHIHLPYPDLSSDLDAALSEMHIDRVNLVSTPDPKEISHNPAVIAYKTTHPQTAFICGGLDHFSVQSNPSSMPAAFAGQVVELNRAGFDGLKLLESKPVARKMINIPLDSPIYEPMWAKLEELALPVVWHVADPEEFWDPVKCPDWVKNSDWFYGDGTYPLKEQLYTEVENVLTRHPGVKVVLAHFFFLSADLPRAADFLDAHPNVCFDLTPGSEMYFNFSAGHEKALSFFERYQDRILFGTDIGASAVGKPGQPLNKEETLARTYVVRAFLETTTRVEIPAGVNHWIRPDAEIIGLGLEGVILNKIYQKNFYKLFGDTPRMLNLPAALELIAKQAFLLDAMAGQPINSIARQVLNSFNS